MTESKKPGENNWHPSAEGGFGKDGFGDSDIPFRSDVIPGMSQGMEDSWAQSSTKNSPVKPRDSYNHQTEVKNPDKRSR